MTIMYAYHNTERGIRERGSLSKFIEPEIVRTVEQIRAEKRAAAIQAQREQALLWSAKIEQARLDAVQAALSAKAVSLYRVIDVRNSKTPVRQLIEQVGVFHGVSYADIVGVSRSRNVVAARYDAINAVRKSRPDLSTPQIGKHFNRDHTTIIHALRKSAANC